MTTHYLNNILIYLRDSYPKFIMWGLTIIMATLLGAAVSTGYQRAIPRIVIGDISVSKTFHKNFDETQIIEIDPSSNLFKNMEKSEWVSSSTFRSPTIPLNELIESLEKNNQKAETYLKKASRFSSDAEIMKILLQDSRTLARAEQFFDKWEINDQFITASLRGSYHRGEIENIRKSQYEEKEKPYLLLSSKYIKKYTSFQGRKIQNKFWSALRLM